MDVTPSSALPKRPTPKRKTEAAPKESVKKPAATPKAKKPRSVRVSAKAPTLAPETTAVAPATTTDLRGAISVAAYYLAERRNFAAGHELDDWLEAERQVLGTR